VILLESLDSQAVPAVCDTMGNCGSAPGDIEPVRRHDTRYPSKPEKSRPHTEQPLDNHTKRRKSYEHDPAAPAAAPGSGPGTSPETKQHPQHPATTGTATARRGSSGADAHQATKHKATGSGPGSGSGSPGSNNANGAGGSTGGSEPADILAMMNDKTTQGWHTKTRAKREDKAEQDAAMVATELHAGNRRTSKPTILIDNLDVSNNTVNKEEMSNEVNLNEVDKALYASVRRKSVDKPTETLKDRKQSDNKASAAATPRTPLRTKSAPASLDPASPSNDLAGFDFGERRSPTTAPLAAVSTPNGGGGSNRRASKPSVDTPTLSLPALQPLSVPQSPSSPTNPRSPVNPMSPSTSMHIPALQGQRSTQEQALAHRQLMEKHEAQKAPVIAPLALQFTAEQEALDRAQNEREEKLERERRRSQQLEQHQEYVRKLQYHHGVPLDHLAAPWRRRQSAQTDEIPLQKDKSNDEDVQLEAFRRAENIVPGSHRSHHKQAPELNKQLGSKSDTGSNRRISLPENELRSMSTGRSGSAGATRPNSTEEGKRQTSRRHTSVEEEIAQMLSLQTSKHSSHKGASKSTSPRNKGGADEKDEQSEDSDTGPTPRELKHRLMASVLGIRRNSTEETRRRPSGVQSSGQSSGSSGNKKKKPTIRIVMGKGGSSSTTGTRYHEDDDYENEE